MASNPQNPTDPFNRITNPDGTPVRDQGNAKPDLKPQFRSVRPAPNLAPPGMMGIRQAPQDRSQNFTGLPSIITITRDARIDDQLYINGRFESTSPEMTFIALVRDNPVPHGIDGGNIERLSLIVDGETVARYNHEWRIGPETVFTQEAVDRIRSALGDRSHHIPNPEHQNEMLPPRDNHQAGLSLDAGIKTETHEYTDGRILTMPGYSFMVRLSDDPSPQGINGGKIKQLVLKKDDQTVALYNHGWELNPKTPEHAEAIHRIRNGMDDRDQRAFEAPEFDLDRDWEMGR